MMIKPFFKLMCSLCATARGEEMGCLNQARHCLLLTARDCLTASSACGDLAPIRTPQAVAHPTE
jgi:hypothetical protein